MIEQIARILCRAGGGMPDDFIMTEQGTHLYGWELYQGIATRAVEELLNHPHKGDFHDTIKGIIDDDINRS